MMMVDGAEGRPQPRGTKKKTSLLKAPSFLIALLFVAFLVHQQYSILLRSTAFQMVNDEIDAILPTISMSTTTSTIVNTTETPPTIFHCSKFAAFPEYSFLLTSIFPEYKWIDIEGEIESGLYWERKHRRRKNLKRFNYRPNSTTTDLFVTHWDNFCTEMAYRFVWQWFEGKVVTVYPEAHQTTRPKQHKDWVELGPGHARENHVLVTFLQVCFWMHVPPPQQQLLFHGPRPMGRQKQFLIYAHSNCIVYREDAFAALANIDTVHYGGPCDGSKGSHWYRKVENATKADNSIALENFQDNAQFFSNYKFCLVLEHESAPGYITEKLLNAFLAGCLPIYFGTTEVFEIFNKDAFVFYDPDHPTPALDLVRRLHQDEALYQRVMEQPVLAHGDETIQEYFSFSNEIGNGVLKKRIRRMLGLDQVTFVS